jgi:hypothetical protein
MREREDAPSMRIVSDVDAERFENDWLAAVVRASPC